MYKLLWASPWNARSAIAHFSAIVVAALTERGHSVEILRTEVGENLALEPLPHTGPVHAHAYWDSRALTHLYDAVIVNFGDYFGFHGGVLPLLERYAPFGIMHDASMGNFMRSWDRSGAQGIADRAWRRERSSDTGPSGVQVLATMLCGAVVHGPHYLEPVARACPGPVTAIPLAFTLEEVQPPRLKSSYLNIVTLGHLNDNKRVDQVICAIGLSPQLRKCATYTLVGPISEHERERLIRLARIVNAPEPIFTGWVPHEDLLVHLENSDVVSCLRNPCLEGGSASLVMALLSARPTLISDHGHYVEVPEGAALRCTPGSEAADVMIHLEGVIDDPAAARQVGLRGRRYALQTRMPGVYADHLVNALNLALPGTAAIRAARRVGDELSWMGALPDDPVADRAGVVLAELLGLAPVERKVTTA